MALKTLAQLPRMLAQSGHRRQDSLILKSTQIRSSLNPLFINRGVPSNRVLHTSSSSRKAAESGNNASLGTQKGQKPTMDEMVFDRIEEFKTGNFTNVYDPKKIEHFRNPPGSDAAHSTDPAMVPRDGTTINGSYALPHPIWSEEEVRNVSVTHKPPRGRTDWMAFITVKALRTGYDFVSGYKTRTRDEGLWLNRIIFLEAVAGVPGMVAAMIRHLHSLRMMRRDFGWIHTLLEEAENERMHLMTALELKQPSMTFKLLVLTSQASFVTLFSIAYMFGPRYCHRFVGYLEEEAVVTYTKCLQDVNDGPLSHWKTKRAPAIAVDYWKLNHDATMKDVILAIRADEAHHRLVNHTLASMERDDFNPYKPGQ